MAAMSVIGIDLGNESCYVAVAKAGGIETIANDYSLRATPSFVAFSEKNRILGVAAKNQQVTNMKNTVFGLKRLLGRKYRDPQVQRELQSLPYNVVETPQGQIGIKVNYLNEEHIFTPEQCLAMLLTKLKDSAAIALQTPINDCVISVPSYFTNNERKALLDSAAIAGLNVLRLFNETTATALSYGIYKQDLPGPDDPPRNVVFVDCGHSSLQVFACAFHKDKLRILSTASDPNLGGRDFDLAVADYFCKDFQTKYKIDAKSNARAFLRLLTEVEKVKKQMSANSTTLPLNIECFMNDKDVHGQIKRTDMEELCQGLLQRAQITLEKCLSTSGLNLNDIHSVEIVGGSSRIPSIKGLIEKIFKKGASTTLNQDEAVARGCALQCAMLSPAVRVREFNIKDAQNYGVWVSWEAGSNGDSAGDVEAFPVNHATPYSKMLTFYRQEPFSVRAYYDSSTPYPDKNIGTWTVKDIRPNLEGKAQKVKVKVRINLHGIMTVSSASLFEAKETSEEEKEEKGEGPADGEGAEQANDVDGAMATDKEAAKEGTTEDGDKDKKKKQTLKAVELPIEAIISGLSQMEINQYTEQEFKMIASDRQEKERADARNAFEEYVYELRGKLSSEDDLAAFVLESERNGLLKKLDDMENWLYEEGEECSRQIYQDKLTELRAQGEPIQVRRIEWEGRPQLLEDFARSLQLGMKALEAIKNSDPKYAHLTDDDVKKLDEAIKKSYQWLDQSRQKCLSSPKHCAPPVTLAQLRQEKADFESTVSPILNKQPPKAPSPPKEEAKKEEQPPSEEKNKGEKQDQENMEWSSTN